MPNQNGKLSHMPDALDKMVFTETLHIRSLYKDACERLGLEPRRLEPVIITWRSVSEEGS
jgi:hypothetical protein